MKSKIIVTLMAIVMITFLFGCASTPVKPQMEGRKDVLFQQSVEETQRVAVDALVVMGFNIKKSDPLYVEGSRPRKVGLFVGSGGETVGIWLESLAEDRTRVLVNTVKSFVGRVGQKNWDDEIITEMEKKLGKKE